MYICHLVNIIFSILVFYHCVFRYELKCGWEADVRKYTLNERKTNNSADFANYKKMFLIGEYLVINPTEVLVLKPDSDGAWAFNVTKPISEVISLDVLPQNQRNKLTICFDSNVSDFLKVLLILY